MQAELVAMATDLAEVLGGALALNLLFGLPLLHGGLITGLVAFALLALTGRGHRPYEHAVIALLAVVLLGFLVGLVRSGPDAGEVAAGLVPALAGTHTLLLACGILGATVMPHVIHLHASLTGERARHLDGEGRRRLIRAAARHPGRHGAGRLVNLAMLVLAVTMFPGTGGRHDRGGPTRGSARRWAAAARSASPCWRRASRRHRSAPTAGRSFCRASCSGPCH